MLHELCCFVRAIPSPSLHPSLLPEAQALAYELGSVEIPEGVYFAHEVASLIESRLSWWELQLVTFQVTIQEPANF